MEELAVFITLIAPIVLAVVQLVKQTVKLPNNYIPLVSLIVGLLIGFLAAPFTDLDVSLRLWGGALAGLGATGLYEAMATRTGYTKK